MADRIAELSSALRTQLAEALCPPREQVGRPAYSGLDCITHTAIADRLLPFVTDLLARARVEGAAEALRDLEDPLDSWWIERAEEDRFTDLDDVIVWLRARATALSASTTTEGDPT